MDIRKARVKDIDQIYSLCLEMISSEDSSSRKTARYLMDIRKRRDDFRKSARAELMKEMRARNSLYLVAESKGTLVGYVRGEICDNFDAFFKPVKIGYLHAIVVKRSHRGKGIASALHKEMLAWLKKNGCSQVHLEVFDTNPSTKIYERWGYKIFINKMSKKI